MTNTRTFRAAQPLWDAAKAKAERQGRTLTEVLVAALTSFLAGPDNPADARLTAEGAILDVVSRHGGEVIIAGPQMHQLVRELADVMAGLEPATAGG